MVVSGEKKIATKIQMKSIVPPFVSLLGNPKGMHDKHRVALPLKNRNFE